MLATNLCIAQQNHQEVTLMSIKNPQVAAVLSNETDCADMVSTQNQRDCLYVFCFFLFLDVA